MNGRTILVAEDEPGFARLVADALAPRGVLVAPTLAAARREATRALGFVLDVRLPDGSSLDLVDALRREGDARPVVYLTGPSDEEAEIANRAVIQNAQIVFKIEGWRAALIAAIRRWEGGGPDPAELVRRRALELGCTESEIEVLELRANGHSIPAIAAARGTGEETVKTLGRRAARRAGHSRVTDLLREWFGRRS